MEDELARVLRRLQPKTLNQIAGYLRWDPQVSDRSPALLSQLSLPDRLKWLSEPAHRVRLAEKVRAVGSHTLGPLRSYRQIVCDLADRIPVGYHAQDSTEDIEVKIVNHICQVAWDSRNPDERERLKAEIEKEAVKQGKGGATMALTALGMGMGAAQLSGFGVYTLASSLLGGLGLSFGFFTGLSSLISVAIGPVGWLGLGLLAIRNLGSPNYKKLLPVVILIGIERQAAKEETSKMKLKRVWSRLWQVLMDWLRLKPVLGSN